MKLDERVRRPIEAVIFDMDGLLLDTETLAMDALVSAGKAMGYDMSREFCYLMIGAPADKCRALVVEKYGFNFPVQQYFATQNEHLREMVETGRLKLKPGVTELLDELGARGLKRAIATSSSRERTDHHLKLSGIYDRFSYIVTRDDVSVGKPNPEPYLCAAKLLGVKPEACLAFEDSYNGVRSAHAAGTCVVMVPDLLPATPEMRERVYAVARDLHEARKLLEELHRPAVVVG